MEMKKNTLYIIFVLIFSLLFLSCQGITPDITPTPTPTPSEGEGEVESTGRVVMVELFNVEGCPACKAINPVMEDLIKNEYSTDEVILVELKGWLDGATPETQERFGWYVEGTKHTPFIAFNGLSDTFSEGVSGGGGGGGGTPQPKDILSGIVTNDVGGPPVEGSKIEVKDGDGVIAETTTDASGKYGFKNIPDGCHDILATMEGRASSKIQNVMIDNSRGSTIADIIHFQNNVPDWECDPPTITVTGIDDGKTYSGTIDNISISIQDESDIKYLFIAIDRIPNELEYDEAYYGETDVEIGDFDTTDFPDGEYKIYFVAYDMNYNRSQLSITVEIDNESSGSKPDAPTGVWPVSFTMGENAGIFSIERDKLINSNNTKKGFDSFIPLRNDRSIDLNAIINAAPADSNIVVYITWDEVENAIGYKVYRKFEGEQNYKYIGASLPYAEPYYLDSSPQLAVGRKVYYQVSAFNSKGESSKSAAEWTKPLARFNINLVSPADGATDVSLTPPMQWSCSNNVGRHQYYELYVLGKNDDDYTLLYETWDETYWDYWNNIGLMLQPLKVYEWNFYYAFACDDIYGIWPDYYYRAISIPGIIVDVDGEDVYITGPLTDAFEFTTGTGS